MQGRLYEPLRRDLSLPLVGDTAGHYTFTVNFDEEWKGLAKVVVFQNGADTAQVLYTGEAPLPAQVCGRGALYVACHGYRRVGDAVAVDCFTYINLIGTAKLAHVRLLPVRGDEGGMLPGELDQLCCKNRVAGIFLMPNCANPTGITLSPDRKKALAEVIRKHSLILIEDDTVSSIRYEVIVQ